MGTKATPQTAMDEQTIESKDLEKMLEERERSKGAKGEANRKFKTVDDGVKAKLDELGIEDDSGETARYRCGRFVITASKTEAKSVSFSTEPSLRLNITPDNPE